ncbi:MAG: outer membrane lipoprotein-sorting protein [Candidatus Eisenbacteria bacterium]|nr:outer membrane lipoprotein-sorting protein [Candidatus Eisenbacteria bacterium]
MKLRRRDSSRPCSPSFRQTSFIRPTRCLAGDAQQRPSRPSSRRKIGKLFLFLGLVVFGWTAALTAAPQNAHKIEDIIDKLDTLYRSESSYSEMTMTVVTPHWERTLALRAWSEGMDKTFIRVIAPKRERGMATLRIGNEMWNYLPKANSVVRVPPSMMMGSWMGSDFTNDDLVRQTTFTEDYTFEFAEVDDPKERLLYLSLTPKADVPVVWSRIGVAVREDDYLPVWERYYDERGRVMRILTFSGYAAFDERTIPAVMRMTPQDEEGSYTEIRYQEIEFNIEVEEEIFTLRNLRAGVQ